MWAYQIEMRPMLFAIEFFFIAVTMFLSPVRCNRDDGARNAARIKYSAQVIRIVGRQIELRFDLPIRGHPRRRSELPAIYRVTSALRGA